MDQITLKDKLHFAISDINDEAFLEALYTIISNSKKQAEYTIPDDYLNVLKDREEKYLSGEIKAYPSEEAEERIKAKYGF